jgi:membrane protein required for beta-lactamase induction
MSQRRVDDRRGSGLVMVIIAVICTVLAVFATIAWLQESTYGAPAIILWVLTVLTWFLSRRRRRG